MKKAILLLCFILSIMIISCAGFTQYEDTNGEDNYRLQSISEEMLIKKSGGLQIGAVSSKSTKNGVTSISSSVHQFDGVESFHSFKKGSYEVKINFTVSSGNARLVITDGNKVIHDFNINEDDQVFEFSCNSTYHLKLAGEACEYDLKAEIISK